MIEPFLHHPLGFAKTDFHRLPGGGDRIGKRNLTRLFHIAAKLALNKDELIRDEQGSVRVSRGIVEDMVAKLDRGEEIFGIKTASHLMLKALVEVSAPIAEDAPALPGTGADGVDIETLAQPGAEQPAPDA